MKKVTKTGKLALITPIPKRGGTLTIKQAAAKPSSKAYKTAMAFARDPKKAEDFLKKAGIITKAGQLAPEYKN